MNDGEQGPASLDTDLSAAPDCPAGLGPKWLTSVLGRLLTLSDLPEPPHHGGWRA